MDTKTTIPLFEANQILSSTHLNQLREYLDNETRYSRTKLMGVGIVCGLNLLKEPTSSEIVISTGYGITTDGHLLELVSPDGLRAVTYKYYLPYTDPMVHAYAFGKDITWDSDWDESGDPPKNTETETSAKKSAKSSKNASAAKPVTLTEVYSDIFELFPSEDTEYTQKARPLTGFENDPDVNKKLLGEMSIVLLAEFDDVDLKSCTGTNCDNKGKRREVTLRMMLVPTKKLTEYDTLKLLTLQDTLGFLNTPRLVGNQLAAITDLNGLKDTYKNNVIKVQASELKNKILAAYNNYHYLLALTDDNVDALAKLDTINAPYIQYAADLVQDISQTYNEFAEEAYCFLSSCGTALAPFPRHLTIAQFNPNAAKPYDTYRTVFFNVPPFDAQDHRLQRARMLFEKMLLLVQSFKDESDKAHTKNDIRLTPDVSAQQSFSGRSVPVYYDPAKLKNLITYWNPEKTMRGREKERYGYNADKYEASVLFTSPFSYALNQMPVLRVEGIGGLNATEVKSQLETLKAQYNLSFDVKLLKLESAAPDLDTAYDCGMDDLQADYLLVRNEMICCIKELQALLDENDGPLNEKAYYDTAKTKSYVKIGEKSKLYLHKDILKETKSGAFSEIVASFFQLGDIVARMNVYADPAAENAIAKLRFSLPDFDYQAFLEAYKTFEYLVVQYRTMFELMLETLERIDADIDLKTGIARQFSTFRDVINRLIAIDCSCIYPKLGILELLCKQRLADKKAAGLFSNYVKANPGLEHYAGVPQNGTLFLVYSNTKIYSAGAASQVVADFAVAGMCCDTNCNPVILSQAEQVLVALNDEITVYLDDIDKMGDDGILIDFLKNDYYSGKPLKDLEDVSVEVIPVSINKGGDDAYSYENIGQLNPETHSGRTVLIYRQKLKNDVAIDFFLVKIKDNKTGLIDFCTIRVIVKKPSAGFISTQPDKAATMVGKTVRINLQVNDNTNYSPDTLTVYLAHELGGPSNDHPFLSEKGNEVTLEKGKDGYYYAIFNSANTSPKIKDTLTDRFYYIVRDNSEPRNFSVTTMVEVDILPCCEANTKFELPRLEFCKNEGPVPFTIDVPETDPKNISVSGPGVAYNATKKVWEFTPSSEKVTDANVSFLLLDTKLDQQLGSIQAKVHPIAKIDSASAVSLTYRNQQYVTISCTSETQEAQEVEWYVNDQVLPEVTMDGLSHLMVTPLKKLSVKLKAYYDKEKDPDCFHEAIVSVDVVPYAPGEAVLPSDSFAARIDSNTVIFKGNEFKNAVGTADAALAADTIKLSDEVSNVLIDKRDWVKYSASEKENFLVQSSETLKRLNTAATKASAPSPAVYTVYKNTAFNVLSLIVETVGTGRSSSSVNAVLKQMGEQFAAVKKAGQFTAEDKTQMTAIIKAVENNKAFSQKLTELAGNM